MFKVYWIVVVACFYSVYTRECFACAYICFYVMLSELQSQRSQFVLIGGTRAINAIADVLLDITRDLTSVACVMSCHVSECVALTSPSLSGRPTTQCTTTQYIALAFISGP